MTWLINDARVLCADCSCGLDKRQVVDSHGKRVQLIKALNLFALVDVWTAELCAGWRTWLKWLAALYYCAILLINVEICIYCSWFPFATDWQIAKDFAKDFAKELSYLDVTLIARCYIFLHSSFSQSTLRLLILRNSEYGLITQFDNMWS